MQSDGKRIYSTKKSVIGQLYGYYTDIINLIASIGDTGMHLLH